MYMYKGEYIVYLKKYEHHGEQTAYSRCIAL